MLALLLVSIRLILFIIVLCLLIIVLILDHLLTSIDIHVVLIIFLPISTAGELSLRIALLAHSILWYIVKNYVVLIHSI